MAFVAGAKYAARHPPKPNLPPDPPPEPEPRPVDDTELTVLVADALAEKGPLAVMQVVQQVLAEGYRSGRPSKERLERMQRAGSDEFIAAGVEAGWWTEKGGWLTLVEE